MLGFLNIHKPIGMTSFDVVAVLRKILHIKQIGHTGTLDPFAQGVLPICIGKATKLIDYLPSDKAYLATVQFGAETETYDIEGKITKTFEKKVTESEILSVLKNFEGEIEQIPPIYSAIKVNGRKLYDYARAGEEIEIKSRKVNIYKIELLNFDKEKQQAQIYIECSKGTYIRSIANDIGEKLNCGGYLIELIRTKAGDFDIENSIKLDDIKSINDVEKNLINPINVIDAPKYELNEIEKEKVSHGMPLKNNKLENTNLVFLLYSGKIYAIGQIEENIIKVKKVFGVL